MIVLGNKTVKDNFQFDSDFALTFNNECFESFQLSEHILNQFANLLNESQCFPDARPNCNDVIRQKLWYKIN